MRRVVTVLGALGLCSVLALVWSGAQSSEAAQGASGKTPYTFKASLVETCSCNLFCSCFFTGEPSPHPMCDAQVGLIVREGNYGAVKLNGLKVHYGGTLGKDTYLTFEPTASQEQVDAVVNIIKAIYGDYWPNIQVERGPVEVTIAGATASVKTKNGEVILKRLENGEKKGQPVVINNLTYFAATNAGFKLYPSEKHVYTGHGKNFNFSKTNGFLIDIAKSGEM